MSDDSASSSESTTPTRPVTAATNNTRGRSNANLAVRTTTRKRKRERERKRKRESKRESKRKRKSKSVRARQSTASSVSSNTSVDEDQAPAPGRSVDASSDENPPPVPAPDQDRGRDQSTEAASSSDSASESPEEKHAPSPTVPKEPVAPRTNRRRSSSVRSAKATKATTAPVFRADSSSESVSPQKVVDPDRVSSRHSSSRGSHTHTRTHKADRRKRSSSVGVDVHDAPTFDVSTKRLDAMSKKELKRGGKAAMAANHPKVLAYFTRLQRMAPEVVREKMAPAKFPRLVALALRYVDEGPGPLVGVLRVMAERELPVDRLYARTPAPSTSATRWRSANLFRAGKEVPRFSIPYLIAANKRLTPVERREWLKAVLDDEVVGKRFDVNRDVHTGGNVLYQSYYKLHVSDPQWYVDLIERGTAVNSCGVRNKTLKDHLQHPPRKRKSPLDVEGRTTVLAALAEHGGKTAAELLM